tara:strand:+ start:431 stop:760 length:330 start_codon:yes stop_codon:yes gene_type:complete
MPRSIIALPFINSVDVRAEIARISREESQSIDILDHALDRMSQKDISIRQVTNVLKNGNPIDRPQWDTVKERGYKLKLEGYSGGQKIIVVAKIVKRQTNTCLVVTSWSD